MNNYSIDKSKAIRLIATVLGVFVGMFLFFKSIKYIAPFLIALTLSIVLEPFIRLLVNKLRFPRKLASILSVIIVLSLIILLLTVLIAKVVSEIGALIDVLPSMLNDAYNAIIDFSSENQFIEFPEEVTTFFTDQLTLIVSYIANLANNAVRYILNTAASLPSVLVFLIITILATYFFLGDKNKFSYMIKSQLPESWYDKLMYLKTNILSSILKLLKAYIIIMCITFTELMIGFTIMKVDYAILIALIIAIFDIMPVLGTGGIVIPWAVYSFIIGDISMGIFLLILYVVILVVRQVIEPKIIGAQIGVHPLLTLGSMYIGLKIAGATGLILGPITFLTLKSTFSVVFKGQSLKELLYSENGD